MIGTVLVVIVAIVFYMVAPKLVERLLAVGIWFAIGAAVLLVIA